jgi:hypothetical protein
MQITTAQDGVHGKLAEREVTTMSIIRPRLAIIGISVLLITAVLAMSAGIANAGSAKATRTLYAKTVSAGGSFLVKIEVSNYGTFGQVIENLPEGFIYRKSTLDPGQVKRGEVGDISDETKTNEWKFTLQDETSFTYTVIAPDREGSYTFSGILKDMNKNECEIGGDTEIVVEEAQEEKMDPTATRTLPKESVSVSEIFTIEMEASHYGYFGTIVETLPDGFDFEDSTLSSKSVEVHDDTVEFELEGEPSFTYTVTAPDEDGSYTFEGILIDEDKDEYDISGDAEIVVVGGEEEEAGEVTRSVNITAREPVDVVVNSAVGELRTFNIAINKPADISWQINGKEVQTNESVKDASYTNTSAVIGTWNVSAIVTDTKTASSDMHTWIWHVTATHTANITSKPTPTSALAPTPLVTSTLKSKLSSRPTSTATPTPAKSAKPAVPGFEPVFALAAIFAVAYMLLFRKKGDEGR